MNLRALLGQRAEDRAERFLCRQGLRLRARNWRCRQGELDLVMDEGPELVFVEVRARGSGARYSAAESVDGGKQRRMALAAGQFLARHPDLADRPARFDVVAFNAGEEIEWIRDAFQLD